MNLDGYVDVAARLRIMHARFPELRLQESAPTVVAVGDRLFISVTITAWRTPDDPLPAIATAWEPALGRTPYTKDSEMMNCATSALGRVANLLLPIGDKLASLEEVLNRRMDGGPDPDTRPQLGARARPATPPDAPPPAATAEPGADGPKPTQKQMNMIRALSNGRDIPELRTMQEASNYIQYLKDAGPT